MLVTKESGIRNPESGTGPVERGRVRRSLRASDQGLTIVYYGDGKGKTTAALGAVLRAVGQGWRCVVIQFIKGSWPSSERDAIPKYLRKLVTIEAGGKGFVGIVDDRLPKLEHKRQARRLFQKVQKLFRKWNKESGIRNKARRRSARFLIHDSKFMIPKLVVLDELLDAVEFGFITEAEVVHLVRQKPSFLHLILTGHKKFPKILAAVDLVTRMKKEKHPFDKGWLAVRGIDY